MLGLQEEKDLYYSFSSYTYPSTIFNYEIESGKSVLYRQPDIDCQGLQARSTPRYQLTALSFSGAATLQTTHFLLGFSRRVKCMPWHSPGPSGVAGSVFTRKLPMVCSVNVPAARSSRTAIFCILSNTRLTSVTSTVLAAARLSKNWFLAAWPRTKCFTTSTRPAGLGLGFGAMAREC